MRQLLINLVSFLFLTSAYADPPKILIVICVDQLRADYFEEPSLQRLPHLHKLKKEGAWFSKCHFTQIPTETAPGHATLMTGAPPSITGIIGNDWIDQKSGDKIYSVENSVGEKTPEWLMAPTLGDILKDKYAQSKVFALGGKDRSTILMAGKKADLVAWYDLRKQRFLSSSHYPLRELPKTFQFSRNPDKTVVEMAKRLIELHDLGSDASPDLLLLALSDTDRIGHTYGIGGDEMSDNLNNVDTQIGDLLHFCQSKWNSDDWALVVTADHGVLPLPEEEMGKKIGALRIDKKTFRNQVIATINNLFPEETDPVIALSLPDLYVKKNDLSSLKKMAHALKKVPGIANVYMPPFEPSDSYRDIYRRSYFPGRSGHLLLRLNKSTLVLNRIEGTTHGSPYSYDTHVPLIFWGACVQPGQHDTVVDVRDIAPTLAAILHIKLPTYEGNRPLSEALKK